MHKTALFVALALLAGLTAAGAGAGPAAEEVLKSTDHSKLGGKIAAWIEANREVRGIADAEQEVRDELEKWGKKKVAGGRHPLALNLTEDLGRALWQSYEYDRVKGIRKGKVATFEIESAHYKTTFEYALHAPSKYNARSEGYPLILCIPDAGESVTDHLTERWVIDSDIKDSAILAAIPMPEKQEDWGTRGAEGQPGGAGILLYVFGDVSRRYAIDFNRVYLAGRGVGVEAAMRIAAMSADRFAGVIGCAGDAADMPIDNFQNLPSFFTGAGRRATDFAKKLDEAGIGNATLKPDGLTQHVWAWIQDHPRVSNPERVVLLAGAPFPRSAYWLEVPASEDRSKTRVQASIDRAENRITIEAVGVVSVTLFFNDLLVDMDRPIKVVCNGVENEDQIPRNLTTMLGLIQGSRSDPGKLYTASKRYDIPAPPSKGEDK